MRMMDTRKSFQRLRSMQCSLHEVFTQASKDHSSCRYETSDYDSYLSHGIKIVKGQSHTTGHDNGHNHE